MLSSPSRVLKTLTLDYIWIKSLYGGWVMLVHGVFSGGGVKGIAFIGAYQVLEEKGIRFDQVAGTSAGALFASLIAAGYTSEELFQMFSDLDFRDFLDETDAFASFPIIRWVPLYWRLGLYKGRALEKWIAGRLWKKGIHTFSDLPPNALRLIASDLTNGTMMVLPDDLPRYGLSWKTFPVAKAVRISCSLPYFFEPVRLKTEKGKIVLVDGGVLSNFPVWLFEEGRMQRKRPIIGIKLSQEKEVIPPKRIKNALQLFEALFTTMMDAHDARYISKKHTANLIFIPTEGINATDFSLSEEKKNTLLQIGRERTKEFLKTWRRVF
ncbi:hypothetical protein B4135_1888 [Caldibacillus debilis]|uniref:PNPLA domain-containing protein n=2 Tax=Caldibacillus debilis TaxID=301148 RepID=A0A150M7A2_9BACI|nr:hypothetical protein B4135_1888 [Caldibacillus debilis]